MLPISSCTSPWFQAKPGTAHRCTPAHWFGEPNDGSDVVKKKSSFPNSVNVGVRLGSVLTMCSACSSTGSAMLTIIGTVLPLPTYGSGACSPATSRSSFRTVGSVGPGWPLT